MTWKLDARGFMTRQRAAKGQAKKPYSATMDGFLRDYAKLIEHSGIGNLWLAASRALDAGLAEAAIALLDHAIASLPDWSALHQLRGRALARLGRRDEAFEALSTGFRLTGNPGDIDARAKLIYNEEQGEFEKRIAKVQKAEEDAGKSPPDSSAYAQLGALYFAVGRLTEALASFDRALELGLDDWHLYWAKADTLLYLGNLEQSLDVLDKVLNTRQEAIILLLRSEVLYLLGQTQKALDDCQAALSLNQYLPTAKQRLRAFQTILQGEDLTVERRRSNLVTAIMVTAWHTEPNLIRQFSGETRQLWKDRTSHPLFLGTKVTPPAFILVEYADDIANGSFAPSLVLREDKPLYTAMIKWKLRHPSEDFGFAFVTMRERARERLEKDGSAPASERSLQTDWVIRKRRQRARARVKATLG